MQVSGFLLLGLLVWLTPASAQSWSNGYAHRRTITINHTKVPNTDQTNFPLLFSGTYSYLATTANGGNVTNSSGYDIMFTSDAGGANPLAYERETYNSATGAVNFWVKIPTASHTTDTVIYMFYGNASVTTDQSNKTGVWDGNFLGVWHSEEASGNLGDSTSNNNSATPTSLTQAVSGQIGSAASYNGSTSDAAVGNLSLFNPTSITVSAWVNAISYPNTFNNIVAKEQTSDPYMGYDLRVSGGSLNFYVASGGAGSYKTATSTQPSSGGWHHVVGTYDGSNIKLFLDGTLVNSAANSGNMDSANASLWFGGSSSFSGRNWNGSIEEVRISNTARSADWITAEYNNQYTPSSFYTVGAGDWTNGYGYQRAITISHSKVPNTYQINFPVLISGTYSYLATTANGGNVTNANGYDIVFSSDSGGSIPLAYERELYNSSTGAAIFWVNIPALSHTADTVIYMFYGKSSVTTDQSNSTAVWDSRHKGVWHLPNGTSLTTTDSTANGNNGTNHGATAGTGQIDGAANVNSGNYIDVGSNLDVSGTTAFTLSAWVKPNGSFSGLYPLIVGAKNQQASIGFVSSTMRPYVTFHYSGGFRDLDSGYTLTAGTWYHIVGTYNGTTENIYINGALQAAGSVSNSITSGNTHNSVIGENIDDGAWLNATIDEPRFSNVARSADWIATEYNTQSSPSTFYSVGATIAVSSLTSLSPSSGPTGTSVTITGTNFGSTQGSSSVTFSGVTATPTSWANTQIVAPVPSGTITGNVVVNVSNLNTNGLAFTDTSAGILIISPGSGSIGTVVMITGLNFGSSQGISTVTFNGTPATPTSWSATQIVVPVPSGATSGNIVVTVSGVQSNGAYFAVTIPAISNVSPSSGVTGTSLTITGSNFGSTQASSTVTVNGAISTPTSWSST